MAIYFPQKSHYTFITLLFVLFFLLSILFFSKRALEPTLSLYRDLNSETPSISSSSISPPPEKASHLSAPEPISVFPPPSEREESSTPPPIFQRSKTVSLESEFDGEVTVEEKHDNNGPVSTVIENGGDFPLEERVVKWDKKCDLYMGSWVKDEDYPLYKPNTCPYVDEAFSCQGNGRPDSEYLKWRWKPDGCDLPRFNATDFLVKLRGKRLMLVGDSMNRNQFESILCMLREGLPDKSRMYETHGYKITKGRGYYIFKFLAEDEEIGEEKTWQLAYKCWVLLGNKLTFVTAFNC